MHAILSFLRWAVGSPQFLEFVRQVMRWLGVTLMTIGVPDSLAGLTTHEDAVLGVVGFAAYAVADGGWITIKCKQFLAWRKARAKRRK